MAWKPTNAYKRITFTVNLPDGKTWEDYDLTTLRARLNPAYLVMGKEKGAGTARPHFQGYVEWPKKKLGSAVDTAFRKTFPLPISVHYEPSMGSAQQNLDYCTKEDKSPFLFGEPTGNEGQGTRMDLAAMFQAVKDGVAEEELVAMDPAKWAVHRRALQEYRSMVTPKRDWPSRLVFLWGPTGTGKTMHAQELSPESVIYREPFMNGYTGSNPTVILDDFDWSKMNPKYWLTLCDRYAMTVETKCGTKNWSPKTIIFTSNDDPKTWWEGTKTPAATLEAIHRRMDEFGDIRHLGSLVPKTTSILDKYLIRPSASAASTTAPRIVPSDAGAGGIASGAGAGAGAGARGDAMDVVDLTQDSETEPFEDSFEDRDWDVHSDASNDDFAAKHGRTLIEHDRRAKKLRFAGH